MGRLVTLPSEERAVVVYAEDTFSHIQLKGYLDALWHQHGQRYQYVTSDPEDPLLESAPPGATTWFVRDQLARLMSRLECGVFITTMPDLGKYHVPRPSVGTTIYVFHSLNSVHTAYRPGAFDNYDAFLCTGPHHVAELSQLRAESPPVLSEVGYFKLDLIRSEHEAFLAEKEASRDVVLIAPSWGRENILESHGVDVVGSLIGSGFQVIVRPHPQFFHSLYPEGARVIEALQGEFRGDNRVQFELTIDSQDSFHRSVLMISDWSGAAFEYALGTLRPVLFVDTPQKIFNPDWEEVGLPAFERVMRSEVGSIAGLNQIGDVGNLAADLVSGTSITADELNALADSLVFNRGQSAEVGAKMINQVAKKWSG